MPDDTAGGELTFIGTATVLVRYGGFTFLTDPYFLHRGDYAKLGYGLRSKRLTEPSLAIADLPRWTSWSSPTTTATTSTRWRPPSWTSGCPSSPPPHAAHKLRRQGFVNPIALETWQFHAFTHGDRSAQVAAMPGTHPPAAQRLLPPVVGSVLDFQTAGQGTFRLYITGDTLLFDDLGEIPRASQAST